MSVDPIRARIEQMIAAEGEQLDRIRAFVEHGVRAGRIARRNAASLLSVAQAAHDFNVEALSALLGEEQ